MLSAPKNATLSVISIETYDVGWEKGRGGGVEQVSAVGHLRRQVIPVDKSLPTTPDCLYYI